MSSRARYDVTHDGGAGSGPIVGLTSTTILPRQDGAAGTSYNRSYALIQSSKDNTDKIFLLLKDNTNAALNTGICLCPGDAYEIARGNLYQGQVQAISTLAGQQLYIQLGS